MGVMRVLVQVHMERLRIHGDSPRNLRPRLMRRSKGSLGREGATAGVVGFDRGLHGDCMA